MAVMVQSKPKYPVSVPTKVVGTTFEGRQSILARCKDLNIMVLHLRRDPQNRYDEDAIAVDAHIGGTPENPEEILQLGFIANSDRMCLVCSKMIDGQSISRSRLVKCPACGNTFGLESSGFDTVICPKPECSNSFEADVNRTYIYPTCFGDEWLRDGLATTLNRAMRAGVEYKCRVLEYTGGGTDDSGKKKTRGCNILIEQLEKDKPV